MASTYTQFLRLTLPTTGELSGTWGATVNTGITQMLEEAIAGRVSIALADADYTPTALNGTTDQARNMVLRFTGALTANRNIVVPTQPKLYIVENATTGGFSLTVKTAAGVGVPVPMGEALPLRCDGTNVVLLFSPRLDGVQTYLGSVAGADNITGTLSPTLTSYRAGQEFKFVAVGGNTGAVTLNVDGLGAKAVTKGTTALVAGELSAGYAYNVIYDGVRFQITGTTFAVTASSAVTANNIGGGVAGAIPYQTAAGLTAFSAAGTAGQVLTSQGTAAPTWTAGAAAVLLTGDQTVAGIKTFSSSPVVPTPALNTNNTQVASTAFVVAQIGDDAPTKTGGGASGTWAINITGSAASATSAGNASTVTTVTTAQVAAGNANIAADAIGSHCGGFTEGSGAGIAYGATGSLTGRPGVWRNLGPSVSAGQLVALAIRVS